MGFTGITPENYGEILWSVLQTVLTFLEKNIEGRLSYVNFPVGCLAKKATSVRFPSVRFPSVWFPSVRFPSVWFGWVTYRRKSYWRKSWPFFVNVNQNGVFSIAATPKNMSGRSDFSNALITMREDGYLTVNTIKKIILNKSKSRTGGPTMTHILKKM